MSSTPYLRAFYLLSRWFSRAKTTGESAKKKNIQESTYDTRNFILDSVRSSPPSRVRDNETEFCIATFRKSDIPQKPNFSSIYSES